MFKLLYQEEANQITIVQQTNKQLQYLVIQRQLDNYNYCLYNCNEFIHFNNKYYHRDVIRTTKRKEQYKCDNYIFTIMCNKICIYNCDNQQRSILITNNCILPHILMYIKNFTVNLYVSIHPSNLNKQTLILNLRLKNTNNKECDDYTIVYRVHKIYIQYYLTQYNVTKTFKSINQLYSWLFKKIIDYLIIL